MSPWNVGNFGTSASLDFLKRKRKAANWALHSCFLAIIIDAEQKSGGYGGTDARLDQIFFKHTQRTSGKFFLYLFCALSRTESHLRLWIRLSNLSRLMWSTCTWSLCVGNPAMKWARDCDIPQGHIFAGSPCISVHLCLRMLGASRGLIFVQSPCLRLPKCKISNRPSSS
jgi:hypothetical protein